MWELASELLPGLDIEDAYEQFIGHTIFENCARLPASQAKMSSQYDTHIKPGARILELLTRVPTEVKPDGRCDHLWSCGRKSSPSGPSKIAQGLHWLATLQFADDQVLEGPEDDSESDEEVEAEEDVESADVTVPLMELSVARDLLCAIIGESLASSEVQVVPLSIGDNGFGLLEVLGEVVTACSLAFPPESGWFESSSAVQTVAATPTFAWPKVDFTAVVGACFVLAGLFPCLAVPGLKRLRAKPPTFGLNKQGRPAGYRCGEFWHVKALALTGNTFFLPIVTTLLSVLRCNAKGLLERQPEMVCGSTTHLALTSAAMVALLLYYPLAVLLYPSLQFQDRTGDFKCSPLFAVINLQGKMMVAVAAAFFSASGDVAVILAVSGTACLAGAATLAIDQSFIVREVNAMRGASLGFAAFACFVGVAKGPGTSPSALWWGLLAAGGLLALVGLLAAPRSPKAAPGEAGTGAAKLKEGAAKMTADVKRELGVVP